MKQVIVNLYPFRSLIASAQLRAIVDHRAVMDIPCIDEGIATFLKATEFIGCGNVFYSINVEHCKASIHVTYDEAFATGNMYEYVKNKFAPIIDKECPFTGHIYDNIFLRHIRNFLAYPDDQLYATYEYLITMCKNELMEAIKDDIDYSLSDNAICDYFQQQDMHFLKNGQSFTYEQD